MLCTRLMLSAYLVQLLAGAGSMAEALGFELKHASHLAAGLYSCACSLGPELRIWLVTDRGLEPWLSQGVTLHLLEPGSMTPRSLAAGVLLRPVWPLTCEAAKGLPGISCPAPSAP